MKDNRFMLCELDAIDIQSVGYNHKIMIITQQYMFECLFNIEIT